MTVPTPVAYGPAVPIRRRAYLVIAVLAGILTASVSLLPAVARAMNVTLNRSWDGAILIAVCTFALATFVFATLVLRHPALGRPHRLAACLALFLAAVSSGGIVVLSSLNRTRCGGPIEACSSSLKQIGTACLLYSNDHHNHYPSQLEDLVLGGYLASPDALLCPTDPQSPAPGTTPAQQAAALAGGAHCSYIYTGAALNNSAAPEAVLAYERFPNGHTSRAGLNVLFADGHTDFLAPSLAPWLLDELASGHNPPRAETLASYRH